MHTQAGSSETGSDEQFSGPDPAVNDVTRAVYAAVDLPEYQVTDTEGGEWLNYTRDFPEGEYETLSGYLVTTTEAIPEQNAEILLEGYKFILELVSDTKIETIRVIKLDGE